MYTDNNKVDGGDGIQKPIEFHLPKYKIPQLPPYKAFMYLSHLIMLVDIPVSNDDKKRGKKKTIFKTLLEYTHCKCKY